MPHFESSGFIIDAMNINMGEYTYDLVANMLDCNILVSKFKLQLHFMFTFEFIASGKVQTLLSHPNYGLNRTTTVLLEAWFWH